ncbi:MAG: thiol peroxidase [Bacillaceae bacterium]|nr:thiol peroxidase [Bacillaceae bacterium]
MATVTFKGNKVTLLGNEIKAGDQAPNFTVLANDLSPVTLEDKSDHVKIISVIPSIDTGVCDSQTRRFNESLAMLTHVSILTISVDLPFAQRKWCASSGLEKVELLSDHRDLSFGLAYGVVIEELRLLTRAIFVIDQNNKVTYVEYVKEASNHPAYDAAIQAVKDLL